MLQAAIRSLEAAVAEHNRRLDLEGDPRGKTQFAPGARDAKETAWLKETGQWGGLLVHRKRDFEVYAVRAPSSDQSDHLVIVSPIRSAAPMPLDAKGAFNVLSALEPAVSLLCSPESEWEPPGIGILGVGVTVFADQLTGRTLLTALYQLFVSRVSLTRVLPGEGEDYWGEEVGERGGPLLNECPLSTSNRAEDWRIYCKAGDGCLFSGCGRWATGARVRAERNLEFDRPSTGLPGRRSRMRCTARVWSFLWEWL